MIEKPLTNKYMKTVFLQWDERSQYEWNVDLGDYKDLVEPRWKGKSTNIEAKRQTP